MHLTLQAPGSNLAARVNKVINDQPQHTAGLVAICYQWFKQQLILSISKLSISQRSQIKQDTVKPAVMHETIISEYALS